MSEELYDVEIHTKLTQITRQEYARSHSEAIRIALERQAGLPQNPWILNVSCRKAKKLKIEGATVVGDVPQMKAYSTRIEDGYGYVKRHHYAESCLAAISKAIENPSSLDINAKSMRVFCQEETNLTEKCGCHVCEALGNLREEIRGIKYE